MGTTVIGGMLAATLLAIFLIPVAYFVVQGFAERRGRRRSLPVDPLPAKVCFSVERQGYLTA